MAEPERTQEARSITIVLLGDPVASQRHRTTKTGIRYTPSKTAHERAALRLVAQHEMRAIGAPLDGALELVHTVERRIPLMSKRRTEMAIRGEIWPTPKPDFDNYAKIVDAFKGVVWRDDAQICRYTFEKRYSLQPKVIFTIKQIG